MGERPQRVFLDPVNKSLMCKVCGEVFHDPHTIDCGHMFCYACIALLRTVQKSCVVCGKVILTVSLNPNVKLSLEIGKLRSACAFEGCNWTGSYSDLKVHRSLCQFRSRKGRKPIDPDCVIDLEGLQMRSRKEVYEQKRDQRSMFPYKKYQKISPLPAQKTHFLGFRASLTMFRSPYLSFIKTGSGFGDKRIMKDVFKNASKKEYIKFGKPILRQDQFSDSNSNIEQSYWASEMESDSMVDESESIQDSNRSSNWNDQEIKGRQAVFLSESSDLYQPEEQENNHVLTGGNFSKTELPSFKSYRVRTRAMVRQERNPSHQDSLSQYPIVLQPRQSTVSRSDDQQINPKEPDIYDESQN